MAPASRAIFCWRSPTRHTVCDKTARTTLCGDLPRMPAGISHTKMSAKRPDNESRAQPWGSYVAEKADAVRRATTKALHDFISSVRHIHHWPKAADAAPEAPHGISIAAVAVTQSRDAGRWGETINKPAKTGATTVGWERI